MDGQTIKKFWDHDIKSLLEQYTQFENLIPNTKGKSGSDHNGEDGRYVEGILKHYISKYIPKELEVLTGFIVRPAVACGKNKERKEDMDEHSTQLDLIIYDTAHYPVFQRIDDNAIVPPEGVVAIISLKKHLRTCDIEKELINLNCAVQLCRGKDRDGKSIRKPFTALVSMETSICDKKNIFNQIEKIHKDTVAYDEMIGYIGALKNWSIYKCHGANNKADYRTFTHVEGNKGRGIQYIIKRIHDVYYSPQRSIYNVPGFVALGGKKEEDELLGKIEYKVDSKIQPKE